MASRFASDEDDLLFVFSVGGGDPERSISSTLGQAVDYATEAGAGIVGIVGRDGGHTARSAHACIVIPMLNASAVRPQTEGMRSALAHLRASHPHVARETTKWEAAAR